MWTDSVAFFLGGSLLLYCLFGGADFGAGILEASLIGAGHRNNRELVNKAIAPVWEANHVWLVLAVVVLFAGFPKAYATLSIGFHIPLTMLLIGIILRGCAFTFRHYDFGRSGHERYYSVVFVLSSFLCPLMLGIIAGGLTLGRLDLSPADSYSGYIAPWCNFMCFSLGVFTCILFAFLASVYLIGEATTADQTRTFISRAKGLNILAIVWGGFVFAASEISNLNLIRLFSSNPISVICLAGATALLWPLWRFIANGQFQWARLAVASQVGCVLLGWFSLQFPVLINGRGPSLPLTIYASAAPDPVMAVLLACLLAGAILIFPTFYYLMKVFKSQT